MAVSVAQYHIMGNTQEQKTQFFNLFQYEHKSNKFSLEIQTLRCKLKPLVNRVSLICPMPDTNILFSFFPPFLFFPHFLMIPPKFFLGPRDLLVKTLFSKREDGNPSFLKKPVHLILIEKMWAHFSRFDICNLKIYIAKLL